jgi:hypothetical protein
MVWWLSQSIARRMMDADDPVHDPEHIERDIWVQPRM